MNTRLTVNDTAFASATRLEPDRLQAQRDAFLADTTAVALLEAMPGAAMILNRHRQVLLANQQLRETLDPADADRVVGMRPGELLQCVRASERPGGCGTTHACSQCGAVGAILECLSTRKRSTHECRIRTSGRMGVGAMDLRVHASWLPIRDQEYVVVAVEDISGEKRRAVLERTFFHDLLNTCAGLQGLAEMLASEQPDLETETSLKQDLTRLSSLAVEQIQSQRQLLAAEQGALGVQVGRVDVAELIASQVSLLRHHPVGQGRHVELENVRKGTLHTDPSLLGRVLTNLLKNALEATPDGGTVSVSAELDSDDLTVSVHNEGVIPQPVQLQIFQRSFSTKGGEGRGVGTYSVKLLTERYLKGDVQFVSNDRLGTLFVIVIPDLARVEHRLAA
ncbi:MAG: sensor histidine kinase [Candidatus Eisenbacteria bacterium]|uniref:Sensor histidine kinase n=1 Tax=Eiseniibacteriota bacterium TaxID=2212470 RepID=A0A933W2D3_UNCEI|nr:sensor histidine kinase [Candidatus Eisenbacteria bacterium]